jgi:hypothetical protein
MRQTDEALARPDEEEKIVIPVSPASAFVQPVVLNNSYFYNMTGRSCY